MNEQDLVREKLLEFLYQTSKNARAIALTYATEPVIIRNLKKEGLANGDINSALVYLVSRHYVKKEAYAGLGDGKVYKYQITADGMENFESKSKFSKINRYPGVAITNINGVTIVGDNNIVNNKFNDLYKELDTLKEEIGKISSFSDQEKINYQADIDSIKSQLTKANPAKDVINSLWISFKVFATINGVAGLYERITQLINSIN